MLTTLRRFLVVVVVLVAQDAVLSGVSVSVSVALTPYAAPAFGSCSSRQQEVRLSCINMLEHIHISHLLPCLSPW